MASSFSLGFEQVRDELMLMQPAGCYWVTADREQDARLLARQCISVQRSVTLITSGSTRDLLTPALQGGPDAIPLILLPETRQALLHLTDDLARILPEKPRLVIFFTSSMLWGKITAEETEEWLKSVQSWLSGKQISLLIVTSGSGINNLRQHLQVFYRHLEGLSQLDWQQGSWHYRIHWWANGDGMLADRAMRLRQGEHCFTLNDREQTTPLALSDEQLCIAANSVLEGAPPLSSLWHLCDDNRAVYERALQANAATVVFALQHSDTIPDMASQIHSLRRTRGSGLKIVVRELQTALRYSDERLLLACGVNAIVPFSAPGSRLLSTLAGIQGQVFNRHVPAGLAALLKSMQPLQERGCVSPEAFCRSVTLLMNNTLLPENGKGLLVQLRTVPELKPEQALTLCKPRRYGDLVTLADDRLYLFLSSCRFNDLETALKFIFRLPHDDIFIDRLVWHEDLQILSAVSQLTGKN